MNARILTKKSRLNMDEGNTNANTAVIGAPGCGKTESYVKPNILELIRMGHSMVVSDTKSNLIRTFGRHLEESGYKVKVLDLIDLTRSDCYDPLSYIENERDVLTFSNVITPTENLKDPFWDYCARYYIQALTALVCFEETPYPKRFSSLLDVYEYENFGNRTRSGMIENLISDAKAKDHYSFAARSYSLFEKIRGSDTTCSSVLCTVSEKLQPFAGKDVLRLFSRNDIDIKSIGDEKTAVFVNISDNDRSMDKVASLFFTQLLNILVRHADNDFDDYKLPIPVDIIIDDFGTQTVIPDFDRVISSVRSRNISLSIILQSIEQLRCSYGDAAKTIISCCDTLLFFGNNDHETEQYVADRADVPLCEVSNMPRWKVWRLERCRMPALEEAYYFKDHPDYKFTGEYDRSHVYALEKKEAPELEVPEVSQDVYLSYDKIISSGQFNTEIRTALNKHLDGDSRSIGSLKHDGYICYSTMLSCAGRLYLCMFEKRKQLLDYAYFNKYIAPIASIYGKQIAYYVLVSFSGFTKEEIEFANKHNILLMDRKGFNGERKSVMLNKGTTSVRKNTEQKGMSAKFMW